jgi:hypothetical protein
MEGADLALNTSRMYGLPVGKTMPMLVRLRAFDDATADHRRLLFWGATGKDNVFTYSS